MKKITAISVVSLLLLASCGGKGKDAASMDYGLEEANEVISYYNTSIDITKKMVDMGEISKIIDYMQKNGKTLVAPVVIRTPVSATDHCFIEPRRLLPVLGCRQSEDVLPSFLRCVQASVCQL